MWRGPFMFFVVCAWLCAPLSCDDGGGGADADADADTDADADADGDADRCGGNAACDDGVFCNGAELCDVTAPGADARGCVQAASGPCPPPTTCLEAERRCQSACDLSPDADGDGHDSADCGGDDCDDADASRFPGNVEVCDAGDVDEDCNQATFGDRDQDGDGWLDAACCNDGAGGSRACGDDCDDQRTNAFPGASEACNGADDDCDELVDEDAPMTRFYEDADHDGYGSAAPDATSTLACVAPEGFAALNNDCDDTNADVHPDQSAFFTTYYCSPPFSEPCGDGTCAQPEGFGCASGSRVDGRWDYDCDGVVQPEPAGFPCAMDCSAGTCGSGGLIYMGAVACGTTVERLTCTCTGGGGCDAAFADEPLPCR